ncbi:hypothetical protein [Candidatus Cardinium sp. TP]|nr:hypothetical protein [Candidatus Cardinium sp. TP]MCT4696875.1 hypothetical protein [Candidatus Cardinium sp. TP]
MRTLGLPYNGSTGVWCFILYNVYNLDLPIGNLLQILLNLPFVKSSS